MKRHEILLLVTIFSLTIFLTFPIVSAQTMLIPNERLDTEFMLGRETDFYEEGFYQVSLDADHWNIAVEIFGDLEVKITVATDSGMSAVIAESGSGWGNHPEVDFTLTSTETVYILVQENSAYGDSGGVYNIGVYDDTHFATLATSGWTFTTTTDLPFNPFDFTNSFFIMMMISILGGGVLLIVFVVCVIRKSKSQIESLQVIRAPQVAIPQKYQSRTEVDDGLRMVRIPVKCPECDAPLSSEVIDWIGPLEAKCSYCGSTVRAKFERI